MCLAMPAQITEIKKEQVATVNIGGIKKDISITLVDNLQVGDFVIIHVGYALAKLNEIEAKKTLALFSEMASMETEQE